MTPRTGTGCNDAAATWAGTPREAETRGRELLGDAGKLLDQGYRPVILYPRGFSLPKGRGPAKGKEPYGESWGLGDVTGAALAGVLERFTANRWIPGMGICLGPGRAPDGKWLIDLEGDGPEAESSWTKLMGGEMVATRGWTSTRGTHRLLACDGDRVLAILGGLKPFQAKVANQPGVYHIPALPGLELRIGGFKSKGVIKQLQSAVPPTPGTDGGPRRWNGIEQVAEAPESFYATLEAIARAATRTDREPELDRVEAYLMGALRNAVKRIEATAEPNRRNAYRDETLTLAGYLHYGLGYEEAELRRTMKNARAIGVSKGDPKVSETVDDAIRDGKAKPIELPDELHAIAIGSAPADSPRARANGRAKPRNKARGTDDAKRPEIAITTERHEVTDQAILALRRDPALFKRHGRLVAIVEEDRDEVPLTGKTMLRGMGGSPQIVALADATLGCALTRNCEFFAWRADRHGEESAIPCHPPDWLIKAVQAAYSYPSVRPLVAVAEVPVLRSDGSIVETPGYDPASRIFYRPQLAFPRVVDRPTRDDAHAAWATLRKVVADFPFASDDDRSVWLAGLLTVLARHAIDGPAPGFAVTANRAGSGKGLLIDAIGLLATGRCISTSSYPDDPVEADKVKLALALSDRSIVHFDNLDEGGAYGNSAMDSALTSYTVGGRILGESRRVDNVPLIATFFLSGNNVVPFKDASRRWIPVRLVSPLERPEERDDLAIPNLRAYLLEHRATLVHAALTILRAHAVAGRPQGGWASLGSFEAWDTIIRGAVWFATDRDCGATRSRAADEAPDRLAKLALLQGWSELPGGTTSGVTARHAVELVVEAPDRFATLYGVLLELGRDGKIATGRNLGNKLRGMKESVIAGFKFVAAGDDRGVALWKVVATQAEPSGSGGGAEVCGSDCSSGSVSHSPRESLTKDSHVTTCGGMCEPYRGEWPRHPLEQSDPQPRRGVAGDEWEEVEV